MDPKIYHYSFSNILYILLFYYVLKLYTSLYIFLLHVNKSYKKKFRCLLNFFVHERKESATSSYFYNQSKYFQGFDKNMFDNKNSILFLSHVVVV